MAPPSSGINRKEIHEEHPHPASTKHYLHRAMMHCKITCFKVPIVQDMQAEWEEEGELHQV